MKKYVVPILAVVASCAALAQSNATISGGVVIGLKHASAKANGTASKNSLENLDAAGSNITFRTVEDLGGGLQASAILNYRFNPTDGSTGAGHDHFANTKLSLSGSFGAVSMGRFWGPVDGLLRPSLDVYTPLGLGTTVFGGPLDASTRYNGMLMYETPEMKGFVAGVAFVPKTSMAGNKVNTTELALRYKVGPLALGLGVTKNAGVSPSAKDNIEGKDVLTVGGSYDFGVARAGLTYSNVDAYGTTAESDRWSTAVRIPLGGSAVVKIGYENQKFKGGASTSAMALGGEYDLSKRTMLFAEAGKVRSDTPSRDETGLTYIAGIRHRF
jgi:predicted porin